MICDNIRTGKNGHLYFAGQDTVELAAKYKTPLYLMDEDKIREKCRIYLDAFEHFLPEGSRPLYASKACSFKQLYRIMTEMGMAMSYHPGKSTRRKKRDMILPERISTAIIKQIRILPMPWTAA